jgi:Protein of unknown function (DUF3303)
MKYMIDYTFRFGGEHDDNLENAETLTRAFGKWKPEEGLNILAFVSNLADTGGYVLVESADPKVVFSFVSKFNSWCACDVVPVIDVGEAVTLGQASMAWARTSAEG